MEVSWPGSHFVESRFLFQRYRKDWRTSSSRSSILGLKRVTTRQTWFGRPEGVGELGINLVAAGGIPDPGVYKCDCGWQLLGTVMGVPMGENASVFRGLPYSQRLLYFGPPVRDIEPQCPRRECTFSCRKLLSSPLGARCQKRFSQRRRNHPDSSWRPTSGLKTSSFPLGRYFAENPRRKRRAPLKKNAKWTFTS